MTARTFRGKRDLRFYHYTGLFAVPYPYTGSLKPARAIHGLLLTAVGLIAGLVADALIHAATAVGSGHSLEAIWHFGIGLVLAASAFARHFTHFGLRRAIGYSVPQFFYDVGLILASAGVIGLIDGPRFASREFWLITAAVGVCLLVRNIYITVCDGYLRQVGTGVLWVGTLAAIVIAFCAPASEGLLWMYPIAIALGAVGQAIFETLRKLP